MNILRPTSSTTFVSYVRGLAALYVTLASFCPVHHPHVLQGPVLRFYPSIITPPPPTTTPLRDGRGNEEGRGRVERWARVSRKEEEEEEDRYIGYSIYDGGNIGNGRWVHNLAVEVMNENRKLDRWYDNGNTKDGKSFQLFFSWGKEGRKVVMQEECRGRINEGQQMEVKKRKLYNTLHSVKILENILDPGRFWK